MKSRYLILFFPIFSGLVQGTPFWRKVVEKPVPHQLQSQIEQNKRHQRLKFKKQEQLEEDRNFKLPPFPEKIIFKKTYDFFEGVPENLHRFMKKSFNFPVLQDGSEIITSHRRLDPRGHVTEGRLGGIKIILKRQHDRVYFYPFLDAAKKKLNELASLKNDHKFSAEDKKFGLCYGHIIGLGNIVPIVGIAKIFRHDQNNDEIVEISPQITGYTLGACIEQKLPPYDTLSDLVRNQTIAIDLLLQLANAYLTLHTCGYNRNDSKLGNIMISRNRSSFDLKLIDWEFCKKIENPFDVTDDIYSLGTIFLHILLGRQYSNYFDGNFDEISRYLNETGIYSKKVALILMQLLMDMLSSNGENNLDMEMVVSRLEALLIDGE